MNLSYKSSHAREGRRSGNSLSDKSSRVRVRRKRASSYEVRPRKDHRGVDLISDRLPFLLLWYAEPNAVNSAIDYDKFYSRSHGVVIRVYDEHGNVIETHEHTGDFKEF